MAMKNKNYTCCQCAFWQMGFDNSCTERIRLYDDFSNQPADQPACEHFEKEELCQ